MTTFRREYRRWMPGPWLSLVVVILRTGKIQTGTLVFTAPILFVSAVSDTVAQRLVVTSFVAYVTVVQDLAPCEASLVSTFIYLHL